MVIVLNPSGLINTNQTAVSPLAAGGNQIMATTQIFENSFPFINVVAIVNIATTATSVAQTLTFNIINSTGAAILQGFTYKSTATIQTLTQQWGGMYRKNDKGTITLVLAQSGSADAQTTAILQGWWVYMVDPEHPTAGQISR